MQVEKIDHHGMFQGNIISKYLLENLIGNILENKGWNEFLFSWKFIKEFNYFNKNC